MIAEAGRRRSHEYAALRARVRDAGLFERQPGFYLRLGCVLLALAAASVVLILTLPLPLVFLLGAPFYAFTLVQIGFLGHDSAHRQVFSRPTQNEALAILCFNLGMGGSAGWWRDKHNQHHAAPNHVDADPDIDMNVLAFTPEQAAGRRGVLRWIVRRQAYLFFPLASLVYPTLQGKSIVFLLRRHDRQALLEGIALLAHYPLFLAAPLIALGLWPGLAFAALVEGLIGVYFALSFAPNHKGMPIIEAGEHPDFLRAQVETSRNIPQHALTDFAFGSLSAQIEHHLFPTMPRNNLRRAEPMVKAFCRSEDIGYYEASVVRSYAEMFGHLRAVSKSIA